MLGRYVELRGVWNEVDWGPDERPGPGVVLGVVKEAGRSDKGVAVLMYDETPPVDQAPVTFKGRVDYIAGCESGPPVFRFEVNASAGRMHGASTAGLVVGAMGVFVFTVALRHWLGERASRPPPCAHR